MKSLHFRFFTLAVLTLFFSIGIFAQTDREKGLAFYDGGDYKSAVESLEKAVAANANDGIAWRFLGMSYAQTDNNKNAKKAFKEALKFADRDLNEEYETPMEITNKQYPRYTEEARENKIKGNVVLFVEFKKDGKIGYIFSYKMLYYGLTDSAIETARKMTFTPAVKDGKAVTVIKRVEYRFDTY